MKITGRGSAQQSKFSGVNGLIAGIGILLSAIMFIFDKPIALGIFLATWAFLLLRSLYQSAANVFGDQGVAHDVSEFSGEISAPMPREKASFADKLRELQGLKDDGLITDEEFRTKRAEILQEKV